MYANAYEMKMPTNYVDMNANEIDYGGGYSYIFDSEYTIAVIEGAIGGAIAGGLLAAVTGPGIIAGAAAGAFTGASIAAVNHVSYKLTGKSAFDHVVDFFTRWW